MIILGLIFTVIIFAFVKRNVAVWLNPFFYFIVLFIIYCLLPSLIFYYFEYNPSNANDITILKNLNYVIYNGYVFFFFSLFILFKKENVKTIRLLNVNTKFIIKVWLLFVFIYLLLFLITSPSIISLWQSRRVSADYWADFNSQYKFVTFSYMVISAVTYSVIKEGKPHLLFLLIPFVFFDILTTSRSLLLFCLLGFVFNWVAVGRKPPNLTVFICSILLISIEFVRGLFAWGELAAYDSILITLMPKEALNTTMSSFIVMESNVKVESLPFLFEVISNFFRPGVFSGLYADSISSFRDILDAESQFEFGLGGSMLSEIYALDSTLIYYLFPFIVCAFFWGIHKVSEKLNFLGIILNLYLITQIYSMYRIGFFVSVPNIIYYIIYSFSWYWILSILLRNKNQVIFREVRTL
ncbi:O-antigen polymerase [Pseudoalteromonas sp. NGC95]|uniref:O-antigen polymerase n=1 Tax=Pseudoalteromonas sp. NGC95 TaxID=2792051 RepID=UPI0018CE424A|nr:O-antigen polymerase [Pseudoalteromonas sp. NGC95]MBH0015102.1 oligosaccharide repeat unit polymerase [Pseudoalteromonas sp. NGC95]